MHYIFFLIATLCNLTLLCPEIDLTIQATPTVEQQAVQAEIIETPSKASNTRNRANVSKRHEMGENFSKYFFKTTKGFIKYGAWLGFITGFSMLVTLPILGIVALCN